jgi:HTH-type transcriptional regulator / antitoxin HigA
MLNTLKTDGESNNPLFRDFQLVVKAWPQVKAVFSVPRTEKEYEHTVKLLNLVLDEGGADETNPLAGLADVLGTLIQAYEAEHLEKITATPQEVLQFLMTENGLKQTDLISEFGTASRVSEFMSGKRDLSKAQIQSLCSRFKVSPIVFMP